jgi:hypothetical protein
MTSKWLKGQSDYKLDKIYVWNAGVCGAGMQHGDARGRLATCTLPWDSAFIWQFS